MAEPSDVEWAKERLRRDLSFWLPSRDGYKQDLRLVLSELDRLTRELREAHAALDNCGVARGSIGHSVRYRIGLLGEEAAEVADLRNKLASVSGWIGEREVLQAQLAELQRENSQQRRHMEALLNTLGASRHPWISKVYRNAKVAWDGINRTQHRALDSERASTRDADGDTKGAADAPSALAPFKEGSNG